jgi:hypothetical protein
MIVLVLRLFLCQSIDGTGMHTYNVYAGVYLQEVFGARVALRP